MANELRVYSGRNRPDLTPVYRLFEQVRGVTVTMEKMRDHAVMARLQAERDAPGADVLVTNSQLDVYAIAPLDVFEPYAAPVARDYPAWLRDPEYRWLSFTAWPRVLMINRAVLGDAHAAWPQSVDDLTAPRFRDLLACAAVQETTSTAYFAAMRLVRGDAAVESLLDALIANGMRVYYSNLKVREALIGERLAAAFANASNVAVHHLAGNAVGAAWLDQGAGALGTHVEAHTVAVLRGCREPELAREFVDFLLGEEVQSLLARLYGETPVNPAAQHGDVRPLSKIRRMDAPLDRVAALLDTTNEMLRVRGFDIPEPVV